MAIHNAIIKRAEKNGIRMEDLGPEEDPQERYKAHWPEYNQVMFGREAKYLLDDMIAVRVMRKEYQSFDVKIEDDNTVTIKVRGTNIEVKGFRAAAAFPKAKQLWMESRQDLDIDDEEADQESEAEIEAEHNEAEEEERVGSVVSEKYRARYAEAGHPNNCGDWLRGVIDGICSNKEGFNLELFEAICNANGVDMSGYKRESKGDKGRFSMTGRNRMSRIVWMMGELKMPETINGGESYRAPQEWRDEVQAKYKYKKPPAPAPKAPVKVG